MHIGVHISTAVAIVISNHSDLTGFTITITIIITITITIISSFSLVELVLWFQGWYVGDVLQGCPSVFGVD